MFYETQLGDTWDVIAKNIYGDEKYADYVMENNPTLIATTIFSAGTLVWIPDCHRMRWRSCRNGGNKCREKEEEPMSKYPTKEKM